MHKYQEEGLFDIVIPIYFGKGIPSFSGFLTDIAQKLEIPIQEFDKHNLDNKKVITYNELKKRKNPLLYLDNYEAISEKINKRKNDKTYEIPDNVRSIYLFLKTDAPQNTFVLLASREKINNLQEEPIELQGLEKKYALDLFLELAKPILRGVDRKSIEKDLDDLYAFTGGHPLTIELIANNISSIHQIKDIVKTKDLSKINLENEEDRLTSLKACFDYTIDKLDEKEKELLFSLTIFKSPFSMSVSENIFDIFSNIVINLYNKSLLMRINSDTRFGNINDAEYLLYDFNIAIRNYLDNRLDNNDKKLRINQNKEKFIYYYSDLISKTFDSWGKPNHNLSMARFNIISKTENNDFDRAIEFGLHHNNSNFKSHSAKISQYLGRIYTNLGHSSLSVKYYNLSLDINIELDDKAGIASVYNNKGMAYYYRGSSEEALTYLQKALKEYLYIKDMAGIASVYNNIGTAYYYRGSSEEALTYLQKALHIHEDINDKPGLANDYWSIGLILQDKGQTDEALKYHQRALEIHESLKDVVGIARDYHRIGLIYKSKNFLDDALKYHQRALEIHESLKDVVGIARDYHRIGLVFQDKISFEEALTYLQKALHIHEDINDKPGLANDYWSIGLILQDKGQTDEALNYYHKAIKIQEQLDDKIGMAMVYFNISFVYLSNDKKIVSKNDPDEALKSLRKSKEILENLEKEKGYVSSFFENVLKRIAEVEKIKGSI